MIRFPFLDSTPPLGFKARFEIRPAKALRVLVVGVALVAGTTLGFVRTARAQDPAVINRLVQLNKKAMNDYDTADFQPARKSLLEAEKLGKRAGLEGHPVMARTYIHLGALYWMGFKDSTRAQAYFGRALDIEPDIKLDKTLTSASLGQLFAKAQAQRASGGSAGGASAAEALFPKKKEGDGMQAPTEPKPSAAPAEATEEEAAAAAAATPAAGGAGNKSVRKAILSPDSPDPDLPASVVALDCPYPDETPLGKKVVLRCAAAHKLHVAKVLLFYKGYEMSGFATVEMARSAKGWWQATLPKKRVDGKSLQFYFEGLDATDKPVVSNGRAESPNVMLVVENANAAAVSAATGGETDENPLEEDGGGPPRIQLGRADRSRVGVDKRYGNRRFWIGMGIGTGVVYVSNGVPESRVASFASQQPNQKVTGFGWAGLGQLVPELGMQLTPDYAVSIESRHQWIPQDKTVAGYTASAAHAVLLKGLRYTTQKRFRLFYGAAVGGGEGIRMNIYSQPGNNVFKDTILVGHVLFGGTGGVYYELSRGISWMAEVNALIGATKFGIGLDFNTAIQFNFGDTSGRAEKEARRREDSVSTSVDDEDPK